MGGDVEGEGVCGGSEGGKVTVQDEPLVSRGTEESRSYQAPWSDEFNYWPPSFRLLLQKYIFFSTDEVILFCVMTEKHKIQGNKEKHPIKRDNVT